MDEFERRLSASMKNAAEHPVDAAAPSIRHRWAKAGGLAAVLVAAAIVSVFVVTGGAADQKDSQKPLAKPGPTSMTGTWRVTKVLDREGHSLLKPEFADKVYLKFSGSRASGSSGCNAIDGPYRQGGPAGGDLRIGTMRTTWVGCAEPPLTQLLPEVRHVRGSGENRTLYDASWRVVVTLQRIRLQCPEQLAQAPDETHGFGPRQFATEDPRLPKPDAAVICIYTAKLKSQGSNGSVMTWVFGSAGFAGNSPSPGIETQISPAQLSELAADLSHVEPPHPPPGYGCTDELGPRYVLLYQAGDRLVGVVVDGYGCNEVRLTTDLSSTVAGTDDSLGAGVFYGPRSLIEHLRAFTNSSR